MNSRLSGFGCRVLLAVTLICACAPKYVYRPEENATASMSGRTAAFYQIPPTAPRGDVRLASFGIAEIMPPGTQSNVFVRAMHLRMVVDNNSDQGWSVDTRQQIIEIDGHGESGPAYGAADASGPVVDVAPSSKRRIDLFFPLRIGIQKAGLIPGFDALWQVTTHRNRQGKNPFRASSNRVN